MIGNMVYQKRKQKSWVNPALSFRLLADDRREAGGVDPALHRPGALDANRDVAHVVEPAVDGRCDGAGEAWINAVD